MNFPRQAMNVSALFVQNKDHLKGVGGLYICQKASEKKAISRAEANIRRLARSHLSLFVTPTADNVVQFKAVDGGDAGWWQIWWQKWKWRWWQKFNLVTK